MAASALCKMAAAVALLLVLVAVPAVLAEDYKVGDGSGWTQAVDYTAWASGKTFRVGDVLEFNYGLSHTVDTVGKAGYDNCDSTGAKSFNDGDTKIRLNTTGPIYFICGTPGHCQSGMKLTVTVQASSGPATPSPPTTPATPPSSPRAPSPPSSTPGSPSTPPSSTSGSPSIPPSSTSGSPSTPPSSPDSPPVSGSTPAAPPSAGSRGVMSYLVMGVAVVLGYGVWIIG